MLRTLISIIAAGVSLIGVGTPGLSEAVESDTMSGSVVNQQAIDNVSERFIAKSAVGSPSAVVRLVAASDGGYNFVSTMSAVNDGKKYEFRGMGDVVRQDMAAFLYRWAGSPQFDPSGYESYFRDVTDTTPHAKAIWWLASQRISTGWEESDGRYFRGMDPIRRQDMAAFLHRLVGNRGPAVDRSISFSDVNESTPHAEDIQWLGNTGVSTGWAESGGYYSYRGMDTVKRQDMAAFLYRLAGSPYFSNPSYSWIRARYVDVNDYTPHSNEIYWLSMEGISYGWPYVPEPTPQTPTPKPQPTIDPQPEPQQTYYKNCAAVRAAGKAPLYRGQPGYRKELDRDGDGIACEK